MKPSSHKIGIAAVNYGLIFGLLLFVLTTSCNSDDYAPLVAEEGEELSGGKATSFIFSPDAFGFSVDGLSLEKQIAFGVGNSLFNQSWVTAPASTTARDGLGPFFNARSCSGCHFKDGRGRPPAFIGELAHGLLLRLTLPGTNANGGTLPDPVYGGQFQDNSILGVEREGTLRITYETVATTYPDGSIVDLQKPIYEMFDLNYGALNPAVQISPRVANQMVGLGLLEAIPESVLLSYEDENDADGDGISGRANYVYDVESAGLKLGRFGWKANQPTIKQQVAAAFSGDLGITSSLFPEENCNSELDCDEIANGGSPEIPDEDLDKVAFYSSTLSVPARRDFDNEDVLHGKELFNAINCSGCHVATFQTGASDVEVLSNQTIRPYTDLLLHDMGDGLADNAPEFKAGGNEWRTPPLWGVGLIKTVNDHTNLLHDGRARNIEEAILWHGGEAETIKKRFMALDKVERTQIIKFIETL
ncbi:di-heme oxidoreductase family protein [Zobellia galactanivorans]|uniref:Cytochrome c-containing protein n=1 Tax=Zobellia galactanivorans (strain DSM 12802 / CCUG 47099 / CIP 106680 / NCIMB 13871 / Dsij) TaxID=63186 RepID=G0L3R8_ZOBGA|nr:di-heme oxidoredictase family protein [Zobellia galactanivorans]CAZ95420.1 Cytochrome c-containing protein [Zobellia galactanivorans]